MELTVKGHGARPLPMGFVVALEVRADGGGER